MTDAPSLSLRRPRRMPLRPGCSASRSPPIAHVACYCESCQAAGRLIEQLPDALPVLGFDGGSDYLLIRKDRIRCIQGGEQLQELRIKPDSPTRRMVARCCNTAMFLDLTKGHWLTLYRGRVGGTVPPLQMRVMTADRPEEIAITDDDVPRYPGRAGELIRKLIITWVAMGFRSPAVSGVPRPGQAPQLGER